MHGGTGSASGEVDIGMISETPPRALVVAHLSPQFRRNTHGGNMHIIGID